MGGQQVGLHCLLWFFVLAENKRQRSTSLPFVHRGSTLLCTLHAIHAALHVLKCNAVMQEAIPEVPLSHQCQLVRANTAPVKPISAKHQVLMGCSILMYASPCHGQPVRLLPLDNQAAALNSPEIALHLHVAQQVHAIPICAAVSQAP